MQIRRANIADRSEILRLLNELSEHVSQLGNPSSNTREQVVDSPVVEEIMNRKDTIIFVAEDGGNLLGLATFYILPNIRHAWHRGHIEDFVVSEKARGRGVGSQLLDFIKQYCKFYAIKVIKLDCDKENKQAQQFYEKNGGKHTEIMYRFDIK